MADLRLVRAGGWKGFFGWAIESGAVAYGTRVAATNFQRFLKEDLQYHQPTEFGYGLGWANRTDPRIDFPKVEGSITQRMNYVGMEIPLFQLMGGSKAVVASGTQGTWTFVYTERLPMGITVDVERNLKEFQYAGCKIKSASFHFMPGGIGEVTWNFLGHGQTTDTVTAKNYTEFDSWQPILCSHCTVSYGASGAVADVSTGVEDVTITIDNHLTEQYGCAATGLLEPVRSGSPYPVTVSADVNMWYRTDAEYDYFQDADDVGLTVACVGPAIESGKYYELSMTIPFARITPTGDPVISDAGLIKMPLHLEAYLEKAASPEELITIVLKNANVTSIIDGL